MTTQLPNGFDTAIFGMGCFWGAERLLWQLEGVQSTAVGYAGGHTANPTYKDICYLDTGHAEVVQVSPGCLHTRDGRTFDAIVLDPPKFAPSAAHADRAARAYKDINRLAFKLLVPGGALFTYSCSGGINADLFHKIVASAGTDAGVDGFISERLFAAPDHPMTVTFPEGEYLKGLVVIKK